MEPIGGDVSAAGGELNSPKSVGSDDLESGFSVKVNEEEPDFENFSIRFKRVLRSENRPKLHGGTLDQKGYASASGRPSELALRKRTTVARKPQPEKRLRKTENVNQSTGGTVNKQNRPKPRKRSA